MEYVKTIRHHFRTTANLARFMGVAPVTVQSWCSGVRNPGPVERRLLHVLGVLLTKAPEIFTTLARPPVREPRPVMSATLRAILRESVIPLPIVPAPIPRKKPGKWDDSYWFERSTSSEAAWRDGEDPVIRVRVAELRRMTDAQEQQFWDEAKAYERRTGRFVPEAED
jgi:hypothetical protein